MTKDDKDTRAKNAMPFRVEAISLKKMEELGLEEERMHLTLTRLFSNFSKEQKFELLRLIDEKMEKRKK